MSSPGRIGMPGRNSPSGTSTIAPQPFDIDVYSENFFAFTHDINGDDWQDIVIIGFPGEETWWFENPQGKPGHWPRHVMLAVTDNESPTFTDITGDGRPDLVCSTGGQIGYAEIPQDDPTQAVGVPCHLAEPRLPAIHARHGRRRRERRRPPGHAGKRTAGGSSRPPDAEGRVLDSFTRCRSAEAGGAQMLVYDVDGDGDNDVVTSKAAHALRPGLVRK